MSSDGTSSGSDVPGRLGRLLWALRGALGACAGREPAMQGVLLAVWRQLSGLEQMFALAWRRYGRGLVMVRRRMGVRPDAASDRMVARRRAPGGVRLPRGLAWLAAGQPALVAHGIYIRTFLSEPEVVAALAGAPALRRRFRALLTALGVEDAHGVMGVPKPARRPRPRLDPAERARRAEDRRSLREERTRWRTYRPGPIPTREEWLARVAANKRTI